MTNTQHIPDGMVPWNGGDSAPADWDGGEALTRENGLEAARTITLQQWQHVDGRRHDIIAYTPRTPTISEDTRERNRMREALTKIAWLRPAGDIDEVGAKELRHLLIQAESIALFALPPLPESMETKGE